MAGQPWWRRTLLTRATVKLEDLHLFAWQLHALQGSGVPLLSSLHALAQQLPPGRFKAVLRQVQDDVKEGKTLSQAMQRHPSAFSPMFIGVIRVGEAGGTLEGSLRQLAQIYEWEIDLRNQLRGALQYPVIILVLLVTAVTILVRFALPQFVRLFSASRIELPLVTRCVLGLSQFLTRYGWLLGLAVVGGSVWWYLFLRSEQGRLRWHTWKLRLPVLGPVFVQLAMSRFARVTAALTASGLPLTETLVLASESVNNRCTRQALLRVQERIKTGESLAAACRREWMFPPVVVQMVSTGEETGRLDELLQRVSEYYDRQVAYTVKRIITMVEPAMLVAVGAGVLVMASSVLLPMWDMVKILKR